MDAQRESFEAYVHARVAALSRIAYLLTGDHHLAEDLVQQTLFQVARRWRRLTDNGDPDPYVRKVIALAIVVVIVVGARRFRRRRTTWSGSANTLRSPG